MRVVTLRNNSWIIGLSIIVLALACRWPWTVQPRTVRWDEPDYLILARNWLRGDGYQIFGKPDLVWPPGAPALAAISLAAGVPEEQALALWHVLLGATACGLLYGLSRDVTGSGTSSLEGRRVAAIAGVLAAISPTLAVWPIYWGSLTESPFVAFLLAGLWATWRWLRYGRWPAALAAGLAFGVSYLIRTEGLFWWALWLPIGLFLTIRGGGRLRASDPQDVAGVDCPSEQLPPRGPMQGRRYVFFRGWCAFANAVIYILAFVIIAAPYVGYLYRHTGRLMISGKTGIVLLLTPHVIEQGGRGQDFTSRLDSSGTEILWLSPEQFEISWLDTVRADPRGTLQQVRANLALAWQALVDPLLGLLIMGLAVLGLFGSRWDRRRWSGEAFWLANLMPLVILFISKVETRYLAPVVPIVLVWAAQGVLHLAGWAAGSISCILSVRPRPLVWSVLITGALLIYGLVGQVAAARAGQASLVSSHEAAGLWLAAHTDADEPVMSRNSELGLYADRPLVAFPNADWAEVLAYARARGARYLVTDSWELTQLRPQLGFLLDPAQAPPEVEHQVTFIGPRRTTLIYRLRD